jgi:hypothetical protein
MPKPGPEFDKDIIATARILYELTQQKAHLLLHQLFPDLERDFNNQRTEVFLRDEERTNGVALGSR